MKYLSFSIRNYRAIDGPVTIDLSKGSLIPLVGLNECGKTTILQAIYAFDTVNDNQYEGKHLIDTKNLYQTKEKDDPIITAKIELKFSNLISEIDDAINSHNEEIEKKINLKKDQNLEEDQEELKELQKEIITAPIINKDDFQGIINIERNLITKIYTIVNIELNEKIGSEVAASIVRSMPYILYNDDFMDRPPNSILIPKKSEGKPSGWLAIFERLFNMTSKDYSLFSIVDETDTRRRDAIISDVQALLNSTLSKAWKQFSLSSASDLSIKLQISPVSGDVKHSHVLDIKITEKINNKERFFGVIDRSKGFLWFYNFVMKLEFNPKVTSPTGHGTIYLLDEPGSYLHYSAQEKLCSKLLKISKKHGTVIYCTHSHTLLNPEIIPLNSIYVVEKDKSKKIIATPISQIKTKNENNNAFQPIHEALQISAFDYGTTKNSIVVVEGIYDKYAIELMCNLENISILPSTSANSIIKNIQFLNGFNKHYIALWDNDEEGQKQYKEAIKYFGSIEGMKFDHLPKMDKHKRRMEDMFEIEDYDIIKRELSLDKLATYEKIISTLFFVQKDTKNRIVKSLSFQTKERFEILTKIIHKRLQYSKNIREGVIDTQNSNE